MTTDHHHDDFSCMIVLLPWGSGHALDDNDGVRCSIERMQGRVAYALAPAPRHGAYGEPVASATHEYVPEGGEPTTQLPVLGAATFQAHLNAARQRLLAWLAPLRRTAYVPVLTAVPEAATASHYFGAPWLPDGTDWPTVNGVPRKFVLQLDTATLPLDHPAWSGKPGLVLFFYSDDEGVDDEGHVILVDPTVPGRVHHVPGLTDVNPTLAITAWHTVVDLPHPETMEGLDGYTDDLGDLVMDVGSDTVDEVKTLDGQGIREREAIEQGITGGCHTYGCDKLGGWPAWEQGDETPEDRNGEPMDHVMQVGYEGLLFADMDLESIDWPTWGRGQIFASATTGEFAYVWACD